MRPSTLLRSLLLSAAAVPLFGVAPVRAQDGFLFEHPRITLSVRGGYQLATASSDVYDDLIDQLTLERDDFSGAAILGELGVVAHPRFDIVASVGRTSMESQSESRTHIGDNDQPIAQTTSLRRTTLTGTLKFYPLPRGRTIGSNAWIPVRLTPFLGIGGGALSYDLDISGEFVDYASCDAENICEIFPATLVSDGWTPTLHLLAGTDYWITTRFGLSAEARYQWASAELSDDFVGFDNIDLSGFQGSVGLSVRF